MSHKLINETFCKPPGHFSDFFQMIFEAVFMLRSSEIDPVAFSILAMKSLPKEKGTKRNQGTEPPNGEEEWVRSFRNHFLSIFFNPWGVVR